MRVSPLPPTHPVGGVRDYAERMSRAFVKEDGGGRWEPPVVFSYQVRRVGENEVLRQSDDLLELLHWLEVQQRGEYELRERGGLLLAASQG